MRAGRHAKGRRCCPARSAATISACLLDWFVRVCFGPFVIIYIIQWAAYTSFKIYLRLILHLCKVLRRLNLKQTTIHEQTAHCYHYLTKPMQNQHQHIITCIATIPCLLQQVNPNLRSDNYCLRRLVLARSRSQLREPKDHHSLQRDQPFHRGQVSARCSRLRQALQNMEIRSKKIG